MGLEHSATVRENLTEPNRTVIGYTHRILHYARLCCGKFHRCMVNYCTLLNQQQGKKAFAKEQIAFRISTTRSRYEESSFAHRTQVLQTALHTLQGRVGIALLFNDIPLCPAHGFTK